MSARCRGAGARHRSGNRCRRAFRLKLPCRRWPARRARGPARAIAPERSFAVEGELVDHAEARRPVERHHGRAVEAQAQAIGVALQLRIDAAHARAVADRREMQAAHERVDAQNRRRARRPSDSSTAPAAEPCSQWRGSGDTRSLNASKASRGAASMRRPAGRSARRRQRRRHPAPAGARLRRSGGPRAPATGGCCRSSASMLMMPKSRVGALRPPASGAPRSLHVSIAASACVDHAVRLQGRPGLDPGRGRTPAIPANCTMPASSRQVCLARARVHPAIAAAAVEIQRHRERHRRLRSHARAPRMHRAVHLHAQVDARQAHVDLQFRRAHVQARIRHLNSPRRSRVANGSPSAAAVRADRARSSAWPRRALSLLGSLSAHVGHPAHR